MSDKPLTIRDLAGARVIECRGEGDHCELAFDNGISVWFFSDDEDGQTWDIDWTASRTMKVAILVHPDRRVIEQPNLHLVDCKPPWRVKLITVPRFHSWWGGQVKLRVDTAPDVLGDIDFDKWKWWNEENTVISE